MIGIEGIPRDKRICRADDDLADALIDSSADFDLLFGEESKSTGDENIQSRKRRTQGGSGRGLAWRADSHRPLETASSKAPSTALGQRRRVDVEVTAFLSTPPIAASSLRIFDSSLLDSLRRGRSSPSSTDLEKDRRRFLPLLCEAAAACAGRGAAASRGTSPRRRVRQ